MRPPPLILIFAASVGTLCLGQTLLPTALAQPSKSAPSLPATYRVLVKNLHVKRTAGGVEVSGQVVNTGTQTLTYTSLVTVLGDANGLELARGDGYLTSGPLRPGQGAEFRAGLLEAPAFTHVTLVLREAGHPVIVETPRTLLTSAQAAESHRTTVW